MNSLAHTLPDNRIRSANTISIRADGRWVVYWMTAFRRRHSNFALQRARDWALQLGRPLIILEALRTRYPWACDRFHRFVIEGMLDNESEFKHTAVTYYPFVETRPGEGTGLVEQLARDACLIVTDDYPCFFHPQMIKIASKKIPAFLECVDSNCLMPLAAWDKTFSVAHSYRRAMQKTLPGFLPESPEPDPLRAKAVKGMEKLERLPREITSHWPMATLEKLLSPGGLSNFPIDHNVLPVESVRGGSRSAQQLLRTFVTKLVRRYDEDRNHPDLNATSLLSAHLHFGHISTHAVFWTLMEAFDWTAEQLSKPNGSKEGFWNVSPSAEAFLDQLCTWREIGFNMCWREPNYDRYESLPEWAKTSLKKHSRDVRPVLYSYDELESAQTGDTLWNAAQRQLVREGRIHNYLRMLWGKRILEWSETPQLALERLIQLNNKFALDGRDPNSYSGIFWILGRYDRAWGPERPIFGKIRYMSSANTARKVRLKEYLKTHGKASGQ